MSIDIVSPSRIDPEHLAMVVQEMRTRGAPTIRAWHDGGTLWRAIEGSHRIEAAHRLGLRPILEPVEWDDVIDDHDFDDLPTTTTVGDMLDYMGCNQIVTRFDVAS